MKSLLAVQVQDGWSVTVEDSFHLYHRDDVLRIAREQGIDEKFIRYQPFPSQQ